MSGRDYLMDLPAVFGGAILAVGVQLLWTTWMGLLICLMGLVCAINWERWE